MRYRTTILFLLACVLAAYPALQSNRETSVCADSYTGSDSGSILSQSVAESPCTASFTQNQMERLLRVLAGICAVGGLISAGKSWRDRQQDRALLSGARLPLWGRGAPYR